METTFMTIHNLTPNANILYASDSIVDILGYHPDEVTGRSCFDYFHPDEVPFARNVHSRGVQLDKAAVLHYARVKGRDGQWIGCECVFTVVYEVLVACTSIYRGDAKNERRATEAPSIRRLFTSSPRDPRYHMLEHLSSKFRTPPQPSLLEPRAALILNRFTRTLTIMYATNAVASILGVTPEVLQSKSFYECMQEDCLPGAIRCLESAKANDSIAYLRFWYRDPRREEDVDEEMREASQSSDSEDGGVELDNEMEIDSAVVPGTSTAQPPQEAPRLNDNSRTSSGQSTDIDNDSAGAIFDHSQASRSSSSSIALAPRPEGGRGRSAPPPAEPFEIEAVVSCTSDGLVVVLRRARPVIPQLQPNLTRFAAPWGNDPIFPHQYQPNRQLPFQHGLNAPQYQAGGPPLDEFMGAVRDIAVFAWSLTGINGNIASYGRGLPRGESVPAGGLPVWDPYSEPKPGYDPPDNQAAQKWAREGPKEPADRNMIPWDFHHPREEKPRGDHDIQGADSIGADRSAPSANTYTANQFAAAQSSADQHLQQQQQHGEKKGEDGNDSGSSQQKGPDEGERSNRDLWY